MLFINKVKHSFDLSCNLPPFQQDEAFLVPPTPDSSLRGIRKGLVTHH
jgi:hypothetical protein